MSERDRLLDALLARALEATGDEREAILAEAGELRAELEEMLALGADMDSGFLETSAHERLRRVALEPGDRIGRFTVRAALARGGSGTVYAAEQDLPRRDVALKVMGHGVFSDAAQARFLAEAQTLARLVHPGIAHVYESGVHDGVPYIAMELVRDAQTLDQHAAGLAPRERLALFASVCDAVHFGHVRGVVHGDLKPANVLVRDGHAKVVDYGIAQAEGAARDVVAGTPAYMAPEQRDAKATLDARSDVYALGVVLRELAPDAAPDLQAILERAADPEPAQRYASAAALADDVRRFLRREPVVARPAGWWHHLVLFTRRRTAVALLLGALAAALVAGIVISTRFAIDADAARTDAERQAYLGTLSAAAFALRLNDVSEARAQLERSPPALRGWEWRHLAAQVRDPSVAYDGSGPELHNGAVARRVPVAADTSSSKRNVLVRNLETGDVVLAVPRTGALIYTCALSPDGSVLYTGTNTGVVRALRLPSGDVLWEDRPSEARVWRLSASSDGEFLCACAYDGTVRVYRAGGQIVRTLQHAGAAFAAAFAPDGTRLYTGGRDERDVRAWDLASGRQLWRAVGHEGNVESLDVGADGSLIASGSLDGTVRLWRAEDGAAQAVIRGHAKGVKAVALHPSEPWVASGSIDSTVRVWDVQSGRQLLRMLGHAWQVRAVAWLADGRRLVSHGREGRVILWDVRRRAVTPAVPGVPPNVLHLRFRDDDSIAMVSDTGTGGGIDVSTLKVEIGPEDPAEAVGLASDGVLRASRGSLATRTSWDGVGAVLGTVSFDKPLHIVPTPSGVVIGDITGHIHHVEKGRVRTRRVYEEPIKALARCGELLATAPLQGPVDLWRGDERVVTTESGERVRSLLYDARRDRLYAGQRDGSVDVLQLPSGRIVARLEGHTAAIKGLALSPDGTRLATASLDGTVRVWHLAWGVSLLTLEGHELSVLSVAWSPDGTRLASGGGGGVASACTVRIWEAPPVR